MQDGWIKTAAPSRSEENHDRASLTVSPRAEPPMPRTAEDSDEGGMVSRIAATAQVAGTRRHAASRGGRGHLNSRRKEGEGLAVAATLMCAKSMRAK
jgi:hypothetical protein